MAESLRLHLRAQGGSGIKGPTADHRDRWAQTPSTQHPPRAGDRTAMRVVTSLGPGLPPAGRARGRTRGGRTGELAPNTHRWRARRVPGGRLCLSNRGGRGRASWSRRWHANDRARDDGITHTRRRTASPELVPVEPWRLLPGPFQRSESVFLLEAQAPVVHVGGSLPGDLQLAGDTVGLDPHGTVRTLDELIHAVGAVNGDPHR